MAIEPCPKCGMPLVKQMSSKPDSTNDVFYCFNCQTEIDVIAENTKKPTESLVSS